MERWRQCELHRMACVRARVYRVSPSSAHAPAAAGCSTATGTRLDVCAAAWLRGVPGRGGGQGLLSGAGALGAVLNVHPSVASPRTHRRGAARASCASVCS